MRERMGQRVETLGWRWKERVEVQGVFAEGGAEMRSVTPKFKCRGMQRVSLRFKCRGM